MDFVTSNTLRNFTSVVIFENREEFADKKIKKRTGFCEKSVALASITGANGAFCCFCGLRPRVEAVIRR